MKTQQETAADMEDYIFNMKLSGQTIDWIMNKVDEKIENHYQQYETFFNMEGFNKIIANKCTIQYGDIVEILLNEGEIDNINNINREELIYGPNSINKIIIQFIDKVIETENPY